MLSRHVNKYLKERHTFNTQVCSYTFGLQNSDQEANRNTGPQIKFPSRDKKRTKPPVIATDELMMASSELRAGYDTRDRTPEQRVFGLNQSSIGLASRQKEGRETLPGISLFGHNPNLEQGKTKTATAQPMSRQQAAQRALMARSQFDVNFLGRQTAGRPNSFGSSDNLSHEQLSFGFHGAEAKPLGESTTQPMSELSLFSQTVKNDKQRNFKRRIRASEHVLACLSAKQKFEP